MRRIVLLAILLISTTASAGPRNRNTARVMSGTAAGVSGAITLAGFITTPEGDAFNKPVLYTGIGMLMVTPSLGEMYAGQYLTWGMGVRAVATGFAIWTLQTQTEPVRCEVINAPHEPTCNSFNDMAYPLLGIAGIAFVGGVWYDVLDAADSADRFNARHGYTVVPAPMQGPNGMAPGLVVSGAF
ncbi:MAG TPA: hypothetical protein VMZ53_10260 [Kofleriaceae bacterium]|nr:hypothetical protein [Kofleriaceae bacterium]